ncbi:MAG: hypothetical protein IPK63_22405 [Candidatus Competibacteraceae bacterium]|nr:hypothetical protein [Candidatus Competibacteraceae bacterium]
MQYIINSSGERVSVILPIAEYEALLSRTSEDETAYLLRELNGSLLLRAIDDIKYGRNIVERELPPDED